MLPLWARLLFVTAYAVTIFCAVLALVSSVLAMSVKEVSAIPVGEEIENLFRKNDYQSALEATTESFRTEARRLRETTGERIAHVERTNRLVRVIMVAGIVCLVMYFSMGPAARSASQNRGGPKMSDTAKPTPSSPDTTAQTEAKSTMTVKPKPPAFELLKRDAGDILRKK